LRRASVHLCVYHVPHGVRCGQPSSSLTGLLVACGAPRVESLGLAMGTVMQHAQPTFAVAVAGAAMTFVAPYLQYFFARSFCSGGDCHNGHTFEPPRCITHPSQLPPRHPLSLSPRTLAGPCSFQFTRSSPTTSRAPTRPSSPNSPQCPCGEYSQPSLQNTHQNTHQKLATKFLTRTVGVPYYDRHPIFLTKTNQFLAVPLCAVRCVRRRECTHTPPMLRRFGPIES
jgi:hypothetical protein